MLLVMVPLIVQWERACVGLAEVPKDGPCAFPKKPPSQIFPLLPVNVTFTLLFTFVSVPPFHQIAIAPKCAAGMVMEPAIDRF